MCFYTEYPGEVLSSQHAAEHAAGNINPHTGEKTGSFPRQHTRLVSTCNKWRQSGGKITGVGSSDRSGHVGGPSKSSDSWESTLTDKVSQFINLVTDRVSQFVNVN